MIAVSWLELCCASGASLRHLVNRRTANRRVSS